MVQCDPANWLADAESFASEGLVSAVDRKIGPGDECSIARSEERVWRRRPRQFPPGAAACDNHPRRAPISPGLRCAAFSTSRVHIQPGLTLFTRIPNGARSSAMQRVRFSTAPFALLYVHRFGCAIRAEMLETLTIGPSPCFFHRLRSTFGPWWHRRSAPPDTSAPSRSAPRPAPATNENALLTRRSTRPHFAKRLPDHARHRTARRAMSPQRKEDVEALPAQFLLDCQRPSPARSLSARRTRPPCRAHAPSRGRCPRSPPSRSPPFP